MEIIKHLTGICGESHLNIYSIFLYAIIIYLIKKIYNKWLMKKI